MAEVGGGAWYKMEMNFKTQVGASQYGGLQTWQRVWFVVQMQQELLLKEGHDLIKIYVKDYSDC